MFAPPPEINVISIFSNRCQELVEFYFDIGMLFFPYVNDNGQKCYSYKNDQLIFEIIEVEKLSDATKNIKIRFHIDDVKGYIEDIKIRGFKIIKDFSETDLSANLIFKDFADNSIELITYKQ